MVSLINRWRIWRLRRRARAAYVRAATYGNDYGCGTMLTDFISGGEISRAKREFDETMEELRKLDPDCPL